MIGKNIKYFRLKNGFSKKEIADACGVKLDVISNFEAGKEKPSIELLEKLARLFNVGVIDFIESWNDSLTFEHGEFRKTTKLSLKKQEFVRTATEEYFGRFFDVIDFLGGEVLPEAPLPYTLEYSDDIEKDATALRLHLKFSDEGPIDNLIGQLENKGFLIFEIDAGDSSFSGMNGLVNGRPYIVLNQTHSAERKRSTIAHELAHLMFRESQEISPKELENKATAIAGAFLLPKKDLVRELGDKRTKLGNVQSLCKEYGVSALLLVKRAELCAIISRSVYQSQCFLMSKRGWRKNEPTRIEPEKPELFTQLVCRAINEEEIGVSKGAELLRLSYQEVCTLCLASSENLYEIC